MVYFLYYKEDVVFGGTFSWIDKWCAMYGLRPIVIDKERGKPDGTKNGFTYSSLDEAVKNKKYKDHKWVWLDSEGDKILDEYDHPKNNVIYCVGSDYNGFGRNNGKLKGDIVKIRQFKDINRFAATVVPMVIYDRFLYLEDRRK